MSAHARAYRDSSLSQPAQPDMPVPTTQQSHVNTRRSSKLPDILTAGLRRNRTSSLPPKAGEPDSKTSIAKEKRDESLDSSVTNGSTTSVTDPFAPPHTQSSSSFIHLHHNSFLHSLHSMSHPQSPATGPGSSTTSVPRRRGSLLVAASDALSHLAHLGRKKRPPIRSETVTPSTPIVLSEVIEISASAARRHEAEDQERERLRDVAAQSLGLGPVLLEDALSRLDNGERRMDNGDSDHTDDEDDERDHPPESDITGFPSVSVTVPMPPPPLPLQPHMTGASSTSVSAVTSSSPSVLSPPHLIPNSTATTTTTTTSTGITSFNPFANRGRSGSIARSHHSHSNSNGHGTGTVNGRGNSSTPLPNLNGIPAFPTTYSTLKGVSQRIAMLPKHYPPPSLLMFALAKQWKSRFIVLTTPALPPFSGASSSQGAIQVHTTGSSLGMGSANLNHTSTTSYRGSSVSYLHLFKSSGDEEKEMERLEINEDSVVFVTDEEVGGRRSVIKVGGIDVGALRRDWNHEEDGKTMWLLQIMDASEAQCWIEAIKHAVLSQRSLRAGLGAVSHNMGGVEPRGDLDVMLSMRAQGLFPSNSEATSPTATPRVQSPVSLSPTTPTHSNYPNETSLSPPSTISRAHSQQGHYRQEQAPTPSQQIAQQHGGGPVQPTPKLQNVAVSALKWLRPRSPSAVSALSETETIEATTPLDESFGSVGTNLLSLRSNSISSENRFPPSSPTYSSPNTTTPSTPRLSTTPESQHLLDRKIIRDGERQLLKLGEWNPSASPTSGGSSSVFGGNGRSSFMAMSKDSDSMRSGSPIRVGSPSLQPPPRRRAWTSSGPGSGVSSTSELRNGYSYSHTNGSTAESFGVKQHHPHQLNGTLSPSFMLMDGSTKKERKPRTSWSSLSSHNSGEVTPSADHHSSIGHSHSKRWSRHGTFSHRLTPPNGAPSSSPPPAPSTPRNSTSARHPYAAADRPPSRSSSLHSSPQSLVLDLRPLSPKRASGSSVHSFTTSASSHHSRSPGHGLFSSPPRSVSAAHSHRVSIPPPQRPAPISALPPTPGEELSSMSPPSPHPPPPISPHSSPPRMPHSAPAAKTSFRDTLVLRAHRLSLSPPTMPPSSTLPPRPDEPGYRVQGHRKTNSNGSVKLGMSTPLAPIPASPTPPLDSPYPPPNGPLPPTPIFNSNTASGNTPPPASTSAPAPTRPTLSLKRRLRMLSAPTPSPPPTPDLSLGSHLGGYQQTPLTASSFSSSLPSPSAASSFTASPSPFDIGFGFGSSGLASSVGGSFTPHTSVGTSNSVSPSNLNGSAAGCISPFSPGQITHPLNIFNDTSVPPTPIGEPITTMQNDPNFLLMSPPTPPPPASLSNLTTTTTSSNATNSSSLNGSMATGIPASVRNSLPLGIGSLKTVLSPPQPPQPVDRPLTSLDNDGPGLMTSLSPPPRRGSRRISVPDKEKLLKSGVGGEGLLSGLSPLKGEFIKDDDGEDGGVEASRRKLEGVREDPPSRSGDDSFFVNGIPGTDADEMGHPRIEIHDPPGLYEEDEDVVDPERDHEYDHDEHEREEDEEHLNEKSGTLSSAASAFGLDSPKARPLDHRCAVSLVDVSL